MYFGLTETSNHSYAYMSSTMSYNTILIYKFRLGSNPRITSSITGKIVLTITPLERLVAAMNIIFDKNTGGKLNNYLYQI